MTEQKKLIVPDEDEKIIQIEIERLTSFKDHPFKVQGDDNLLGKGTIESINELLGVLNDGTVVGVPEKAAPDMVKNFITVVSNPAIFTPTVYLVPEIIKYDESRTIIHVQ